MTSENGEATFYSWRRQSRISLREASVTALWRGGTLLSGDRSINDTVRSQLRFTAGDDIIRRMSTPGTARATAIGILFSDNQAMMTSTLYQYQLVVATTLTYSFRTSATTSAPSASRLEEDWY